MSTLPALLEQIERIGQHCAAEDFAAAQAAFAEFDRALRGFTPAATEAEAAWPTSAWSSACHWTATAPGKLCRHCAKACAHGRPT
jgi:Ser/Thr protein kinase RdoA (MazF antagonist)